MANNDLFDAYFRRADLDGDGQISGAEAVGFSQGANLPKHVLAQIWAYADQKKVGYLGRADFYNFLKLVTVAQSKRELTPDMVKAALYGHASAKIPPPQINIVTRPAPQSKAAGPVPQAVTSASPQSIGIRGPPNIGNAGGNQQYFPAQQNQFMRPPQGILPGAPSQPQPAFASQGMPRGVTPAAPPPSSTISTDWLRGSTGGFLDVVNPQLPNKDNNSSTNQDPSVPAVSGIASSFQPRPQMTAGQTTSMPPKPQDQLTPSDQLEDKDSKASVTSGNGFPSDPLFGDVFSAIPAQPNQNFLAAPSSISTSSVSTGTPSAVPVTSVKSSPHESLPTTFSQHPVVGQHQQSQSTGKPGEQPATQSTTAPSATGFSVGAGNLASSQSTQSQHPWPKMTPAEVQKYTKVFVQVDTDKDGKITGEQARNLFLSWRLPREILKQVWDLSDQDNDSMLSFREFCIALYLMERYREGRPLPTILPGNIMPGETQGFGTGQPTAAYGSATWRPAHGFQQPNIPGASRPPAPVARGKPPRPVPSSHTEGAMPAGHQKPKVPVLEKHLVDQLSKEEQDSLNVKFQEAIAINKKVEELEKEIADSKQKIEFCRAKMQELILYKSRCDNRLNEIMERVSADKREVESLARKYEEKYKQTGDVASKLTIEEATFRDIQEKKMELYQAIVKMEEGNTENGVLKERAESIESGLAELIKTLNERCKQYVLRGKPTTLVELPYGWQPGIQEGAADWDEDWDKFDDEGFTFVKELTLDEQNVIAPPKQKFSPIENGTSSSTNEVFNASSSDIDAKSEKVSITDEHSPKKELVSEQGDALKRSPPVSPAGRGAAENQTPEFQDSNNVKSNDADSSPHAEDNRSDHGGAESTVSADKLFDEPSWGTFDSHYDTDSVWGFDPDSGKDGDHRMNDDLSGFGLGDFNIKPIKTGSTNMDSMFPGRSQSVFADSVPSTPAYNFGNSPQRFSEGSEFGIRPMTETPRTDNIFSGGPSLFADSVPSTPAYSFGNSPHRFSEDHSFDSLSRFDSFNMHDGGFSQSPHHSLARFDSMRSTSDSDLFPSRFDSFNAQRFDSFNAQRFDSLSVHDSGFSHSPRNSLSRFDSMHSTKDSDYSHGFSSFDETDPFGSSGPFKTSLDSQTPRRSSDNWSAF